ncbi:hypothetical protein L3Q82_016322 [Scortum barcoo]|uniref:Uncharacterized protein n=1 Tax=Scortum barcoo TaxID=214431 RepID=A0ACB8VR00_9TELE|nr:hypothetical protein L3Q82_016322 [Scortum barcoo]
MFLDSVAKVGVAVESGVVIQGTFTPVLPLVSPAKKVIISNAPPPFIKNEALIKELSRRQVFMVLKDNTAELNLSFNFKVEGFNYMVFATSETMKCFGCGAEGHLIRSCPGIVLQGQAVLDRASISGRGQLPPLAPAERPPLRAGPLVLWTRSHMMSSTVRVKGMEQVGGSSQEKEEAQQNRLLCDELLADEVMSDEESLKTSQKRKNPARLQTRFKALKVTGGEKAGNCSAESDSELMTTQVREQNYPPGKIKKFLQDTKGLRLVDPEDNIKLEAGLSLAELHAALMSLQNGKAPVIMDCLETGRLPLSCRRAVITLLPKKGDLQELKNWRPVSLLCTDYKILSKVLACRLRESVLFLPKEEGGQGLVHLASRGAAFRLQFIQRLLSGPKDLVWRPLAYCILQRVGGLGLSASLFLMDWKKPREATEEELLLAHMKHYVDLMKSTQTMTESELHTLSERYDSVYLHPESFQVCVSAVGSVLQLVDRVLNSDLRNGFAVIRPPGHHAQSNESNGFCIFNNVAIAARYARTRHSISRVLIVDWDVHHGQGIQYLFQEDPSVLYFSVHRYEGGFFWPHLPESDSRFVGSGRAEGRNINLAWNKTGMTDADYITAFQQLLLPVAHEFQPQLVLVSAGFDAAVGDPKGEMCVSPQCFHVLTHLLMSLAEGRVILALEGGYNLQSTAEGTAACVRALLGGACPPLTPPTAPSDRLAEGRLEPEPSPAEEPPLRREAPPHRLRPRQGRDTAGRLIVRPGSSQLRQMDRLSVMTAWLSRLSQAAQKVSFGLPWMDTACVLLRRAGCLAYDKHLFLLQPQSLNLTGLTPFYQSVLQTWQVLTFHRKDEKTPGMWLFEEPLFGNNFITSQVLSSRDPD